MPIKYSLLKTMILCLFSIAITSKYALTSAGELKLDTDPDFVTITNKRYVLVGLDPETQEAKVIFSVDPSKTLDSLDWTFDPGSPGTASGNGPHEVIYSSAGVSNKVEFSAERKDEENQTCTTAPKTTCTVVVPQIQPDSGQIGTNGDIVPSNKGETGELHYVSPRKDGEFVVFKASYGSPPFAFSDAFEWEGGEAVEGSPEKRRVSRGTSEKTVVKLKRKSDGTILAKINVWIVFATGSVRHVPQIAFLHTSDRELIDGTRANIANFAVGATSADYDYWQIVFRILPSEMFNLQNDVPDFTGTPTPPPGGKHQFSNRQLSDGASGKWDTSQQLKIMIRNNAGQAGGKWPSNSSFSYTPALLNAQPNPDSVIVDFTQDPILGNDDTYGASSPYTQDSGASYHDVGEMVHTDRPGTNFSDFGFSEGDTMEEDNIWKTFVRLNIGDKWYLVSTYVSWHIFYKVKLQNGVIVNNGTTASQDSGL